MACDFCTHTAEKYEEMKKMEDGPWNDYGRASFKSLNLYQCRSRSNMMRRILSGLNKLRFGFNVMGQEWV